MGKLPFDGHEFILFIKELGSHRRVGHEQAVQGVLVCMKLREDHGRDILQDGDRRSDGDQTKKEKDDLVRFEDGRLDVT